MGLIQDVKHLLTLKEVRDRLSLSAGGRALMTAVFAVVGAVLTAIVAQYTAACPALLTNLSSILTAGFGGGATYFFLRKPLQNAAGKATITGLLGAAVAGLLQQVTALCGSDFVHQLGPLAMAGVWIGLGHYLQAPHESPAPASVPPTAAGH